MAVEKDSQLTSEMAEWEEATVADGLASGGTQEKNVVMMGDDARIAATVRCGESAPPRFPTGVCC